MCPLFWGKIRNEALIDSILLLIPILPIIYFFVFRPLQFQLIERKRSEEELKINSAKLKRKNDELQDALAKVKHLSGRLPICAWCKKIRDDKGYWNQLEKYISEHTDTVFSHGMCPECEEKTRKELDEFKAKKSSDFNTKS